MRSKYKKFLLIFGLLFLTGQGCLSTGGSKTGTYGPGGMFISTDKGESWTAISYVPTINGVKNVSNMSIFRLTGDPHDIGTMYWQTREQGFLYTYDDGRTWRENPSPLNAGFVYSLAVHPKEPCTLFATNGRQIFKSQDCGRLWSEVFREGRPAEIVRSIAIDPFPPHHIYALEENGDMLMSYDFGRSWSVTEHFGWSPIQSIIFDKNREGLVYITTSEQGLYRSFDRGKTWESIKEKLEAYAGSLSYRGFHLYPTEANHIYWISKYGILVSRNAGDDWDALELITPPGSAGIYGFAVNPKNDKEIYYTATINAKSTFYKSMDGGKTWVTSRLPSGQIPTAILVHPENTNWIYLGFTILQQK